MLRAHVPILVLIGLVGVVGCRQTPPDSTADGPDTTAATAPTVPEISAAPLAAPRPSVATGDATIAGATLVGAVAETMNSGGYTYVRLKREADDVWVAAREFDATIGEELKVSVAVTMRDFKSPTLNRTFPILYFVSEVARKGEKLSPPSAAPAPPPMTPLTSHGSGEAPVTAPQAPPITKLAPPTGGVSVADVFARRTELSGRPVIVRGTVVKVNRGILDRNWLHLQDGSGSEATQTHDLTVTTAVDAVSVQPGDIVTATGVLALKKDFGAGYAYDAILEGATISR